MRFAKMEERRIATEKFFSDKSIMTVSPCNEFTIKQDHAIHDLTVQCIAILNFLDINLGFCTHARFQRVNT